MSLRKKMLVSLFAALLCISSYIIIPIGPVPVTLQVLFVLLAGAVLGPELGAISVLLWILIGTVGMPVFAGGKAGPMVLVGPTGGYLVGFVLCAWIVGRVFRKDPSSRLLACGAMFAGLTVAYILGLLGFMLSFAFFLGKPMTWMQALSIAVVPFVPVDLVKLAAGAWVAPTLIRALSRAGLAVENRANT